jgi:hypothetical protein
MQNASASVQSPAALRLRGSLKTSPQDNSVIQPILSPELPGNITLARARITAAWLRDETEAVNDLLAQASLPPVEREKAFC